MVSAKTIPGPRGDLFFGNIKQFGENPLGYLQSVVHEYGDVARMRFGRKNMYLTNQPEYIREILVEKADNFHKGKALQLSRSVLGDGLLTSEGQLHLQHRRTMQPAFRKDSVDEHAGTMVRHTHRLIANWSNGETRMISSDMMGLALGIISETMFGYERVEDTEKIGKSIEQLLEYITYRMTSFVPAFIPTRRKKIFHEAKGVLDEIVYRIIDTRRAQHGDDRRGDLLSILMKANHDTSGKGVTDEQLRNQVMNIFVSGQGTTASTLGWTWYLLATHPEVEAKFHEELDRVLQGRDPELSDISSLTYLRQIIMESMRKFPAAWTIGYDAVNKVQIGKWEFEPGDGFLMSQYLMHRNPKYFDRVEEFIPERWTEEFIQQLPQFAYFPFGGGARSCIGNHMGMMEVTLVLATIGQHYRLEMLDNEPLIPMPLITLRPKNGVQMRVVSRA
ncbi:cytochrome P450 [Paenibacillus sp. NPDC055715]